MPCLASFDLNSILNNYNSKNLLVYKYARSVIRQINLLIASPHLDYISPYTSSGVATNSITIVVQSYGNK